MREEEYRLHASHVTDSYDRFARYYDRFVGIFRLKGTREKTVEVSDARPEDRVLDVCTGTGDAALEFAKRCKDVTGVDLSTRMLAVAEKKDGEGRIRFLQMDAANMDFADKEFDISIISLALHDMPAEVREMILREMVRVTRKRIVILDYGPPPNRFLRALYVAFVSLWESGSFRDFVRRDFEGLLRRCGLRVEKERGASLSLLRLSVCRPAEVGE